MEVELDNKTNDVYQCYILHTKLSVDKHFCTCSNKSCTGSWHVAQEEASCLLGKADDQLLKCSNGSNRRILFYICLFHLHSKILTSLSSLLRATTLSTLRWSLCGPWRPVPGGTCLGSHCNDTY